MCSKTADPVGQPDPIDHVTHQMRVVLTMTPPLRHLILRSHLANSRQGWRFGKPSDVLGGHGDGVDGDNSEGGIASDDIW
jgi:hypothetical protein